MVRSFITCLIAALLLLTFYTPAKAIDLYAMGSYWDTDQTDGTWGLGLGAGISLLTDRLRLDGRVYLFEDADFDDDDEIELLPIDLGLQVHILPNAKWDPYVLGGISYIYADGDRVDVDSDFGAYLGGGVEYDLISAFKLFGEVSYRWAELESDFGARDEDIDVSGGTGNVGIKLHF